MKNLLAKVDRFQQRHRATAVVYGVVKKYGDDQGGSLSALIAYYGFLSLFPLLLLFFTATSYILPHYPDAQKSLTSSVLGEFPVIGAQLKANVGHPLRGSPLALIVGVVGLMWGALGISQVLQKTMYEVWRIPRRDHPKFVARVTKGLLLFVLLGLGIAATTAVTSLGSVLDWGPFGSVLAAIPAALVNIGVFFGVFRLLSPPETSEDLLPGAIIGGVGWQVLQTVGVNLVIHQLRTSSQVYGVFGFTLALLSFLYLAGQLTMYAAEANVVRARHLWPRSLVGEPEEGDAATGRDRQGQVPLTPDRAGSAPAIP